MHLRDLARLEQNIGFKIKSSSHGGIISSLHQITEVPSATYRMNPLNLPKGIRSRMVNNINGLTMYGLEAGFEQKAKGRILLLHGFPELAFSWRKVMLPLALAGYHVIAPDQRGFG